MSSTSCYFVDPASNPIGPTHRKIVYLAGPGASSHGTHTAGTAVGDAFPSNSSTANRGLAYLARIAHTTGFAQRHVRERRGDAWLRRRAAPHELVGQRLDDFLQHAVPADRRLPVGERGPPGALRRDQPGHTAQPGEREERAGDRRHAERHVGRHEVLGRSGPGRPTAAASPRSSPPDAASCPPARPTCSTSSQSGTSMACPGAAAAGALVRQYFSEGFHPSGTKVPSERVHAHRRPAEGGPRESSSDMTGVAGYPSDVEGWGKLVLDESLHFAGDAAQSAHGRRRPPGGGAPGQRDGDNRAEVVSSSVPLEVTLAFTDHPGTINASNPVVNDVDLVVTAPGGAVTYLGNVFAGGWSEAGGSADAKNNVERVAVALPTAGTWRATVTARSVPQPGQGFALVVTGDFAGRLTAAWSARFGAGKAGFRGHPGPHVRATAPRIAVVARTSWALENAPGLSCCWGSRPRRRRSTAERSWVSLDAYLQIATLPAARSRSRCSCRMTRPCAGSRCTGRPGSRTIRGQRAPGPAASNGLRTRLGL